MDGYISKPVTAGAIADVLERWLFRQPATEAATK
jgi:hypothetical protein